MDGLQSKVGWGGERRRLEEGSRSGATGTKISWNWNGMCRCRGQIAHGLIKLTARRVGW